jgi:hypothetical protein
MCPAHSGLLTVRNVATLRHRPWPRLLPADQVHDGASFVSVAHCPRHARAQLRHPEVRRQSSRYGVLCQLPAQVLYPIRLSARPRARGGVFARQVRNAQVSGSGKEMTTRKVGHPRPESTRPLPIPKDTVALDRSTANTAPRNVSSGIPPHAIPDDGTAIWPRPDRPEESNLRTPGTGPARQTQMPHRWDCG